MKTESKTLDKCQVELSVTLDAEEAKAIVKEVERTFVREARLPGFRPGKVPIELIRKQFAQGLQQEKERTAVEKHIQAAIEAEKLDRVAVTEIKEVSVSADGANFSAVVEVRPKFKLPAYKGLKIEERDVTVKQEELDEQMNRLRMAYARYEDAKEGEAVAPGDFVQIDYSGTVDGKPIAEINPEAKIVATGTGFWTQVEEGRFLPEILDAIVGMKIGETKSDVAATFDKESAPEGLKGAKAVYTVTLKAFRHRILPTDAEFVEKTKAESLEKLTETMRNNMQKHADQMEARRREDEVVDLLLEKADFDVPGSQVNRVMDAQLQEFAMRAQQSGIDAGYFEQNREKIRKDAEEAATKRVRMWYIIDAIAEAEKIEAKEEERGRKVFDFILANVKK